MSTATMDIPQPDGPDVNSGTGIVVTGWSLTGLVAATLLFRILVKIWISVGLAPTARPRRIWGLEDAFLFAGFIVDVGHQSMIWKSYENGLGRHYYYLSPEERRLAMKWDWIAAQLAVTAVSLSRTGVMCFLYACFAKNRRQIAITLLACIAIHTAVNLVTVLQAIMQCGPNPYRPTNRAAYYRYLWDPLPEDGSVVCESPKVQEFIGYGQGAFNASIDFMLVGLAAFEIWQFLFLAHSNRLHNGLSKFRKLEPHVRRQRLWQTVLVCGPLSLSGVACIIKSPLVGAIGQRMDITWNLMPLILWVKIENYTIPIGATATVMRLFIKAFMNKNGRSEPYGYGTSHHAHAASRAVELENRSRSNWENERPDDHKKDDVSDVGTRSLHGSETGLVDDNIHVKVEYEVRVMTQDSRDSSADHRSTVTGGRSLP